LLADVLLPAQVRQRIKEAAPECLIVVPDDALHKLPLEALVLRSGKEPAYALDELPPLVYAPSVAILALLADRQPLPVPGVGLRRGMKTGPLSLLTVADPAYPAGKTAAGAPKQVVARGLLGLMGELPRLRYTALESERISRVFERPRVTVLRGRQATEKALVAALPGQRIIHIAVHGLADDRFGNKFGALALALSAGPRNGEWEAPEDDGFLSLHEICTLPLGDCELAVLSACVTNVGPQRPLEAGVTLAGGFLTAGAHRVVASHWSVDDRSTAELMEVFFREVASAAGQGQQASYARALQQARRQVRGQTQWSAPFYWAPFVLVGPPD
jgi:CHAT domain-containing protein